MTSPWLFEREGVNNYQIFMKKESGTYVLVLQVTHTAKIQVGALGEFSLKPGFYLYVGSAHGPGGVAARVKRHLSGEKKTHWHIDYLTPHAPIIEVWYAYGERKLEHTWASILEKMTGNRNNLKGFGSSDCSCKTHLFFFGTRPSLQEFQKTTQNDGFLQVQHTCSIFLHPTNHIFCQLIRFLNLWLIHHPTPI